MNLKVLAVTSWGGACGIANYADMLKGAMTPLDVEIRPNAALLDPRQLVPLDRQLMDVLWLNYHAGLHSRWTPEVVEQVRKFGVPIVCTYHDTYDGTRSPNSDNAKAIAKIVDRFIVHEPTSDIPEAVVIRQGIPFPSTPVLPDTDALRYATQPVLGTAGFDFPWKNYTRLAELTAEIGWGLLILSNNITYERKKELWAINRYALIENDFLPTTLLVSFLAGCTATAWMYECANSGTSGAIRLGIAAMRPLYALRGCRQMRDLIDLESTRGMWVDTWADLKYRLVQDPIQGGFPPAAALYATDSWERQARKYHDIFRSLSR